MMMAPTNTNMPNNSKSKTQMKKDSKNEYTNNKYSSSKQSIFQGFPKTNKSKN